MTARHFATVEVRGVVCTEAKMVPDHSDRRPALLLEIQVQGEPVKVRAYVDAVIAKLAAVPLWAEVHVVGRMVGNRIVIDEVREVPR